jgi:hypothetical protein
VGHCEQQYSRSSKQTDLFTQKHMLKRAKIKGTVRPDI